jgi:hypothetical protein
MIEFMQQEQTECGPRIAFQNRWKKNCGAINDNGSGKRVRKAGDRFFFN